MSENNEQKYQAGDRFRVLSNSPYKMPRELILEFIEYMEDDDTWGRFNVIAPPKRKSKKPWGVWLGHVKKISLDTENLVPDTFDPAGGDPTDTENPLLDIIEQVSQLKVSSENVWIKAAVLLMLDKLQELSK
jgi:hypothetical protein